MIVWRVTAIRRNALQAALGAVVWLAMGGYWFYRSFNAGFCDRGGFFFMAIAYGACGAIYFGLAFFLSLRVHLSYPLVVLIAFVSSVTSYGPFLCFDRRVILHNAHDAIVIGSICYLLVHCWFSKASTISRAVQISIAVVVLLALAIIKTGYVRHPCGHKQYLRDVASELLQLYYEPHSCNAATRLQLCRDVYKAQRIHKQQFGAYATSLNQLERSAFIRFKSDGVRGMIDCNFSPTSWVARMDFNTHRDGGGAYSVTEAGTVWFEDENMIGPAKRIIADLH